MDIEIYRMSPDVRMPKFGTDRATCFDIEYCPVSDIVTGYDRYNIVITRYVNKTTDDITINPGDRLLIPTGLVFAFNENTQRQYSLRLHARSGFALKRGLVLANSTGVVDVDYRQQVYALMVNTSDMVQTILKYERICQGEIVRNEFFNFEETLKYPEKFGNRTGGFGSTGTT